MASAAQSVSRALEMAIWAEVRLSAASNLIVSAIGATRSGSAVRKDVQCALAEVEHARGKIQKTIARERRR